jgi:ferredoxin
MEDKWKFEHCVHTDACKRIWMLRSPIYQDLSKCIKCGTCPIFFERPS